MIRHALLTLACAFGVTGTAYAQQIVTYTQTQAGLNLLPYGLPVPLPIDSLTPVDGFRSYASLEARLQGLALGSADLSAHDVGRTFNNRTVWAYVASDEDGVDVEGRPEAAFFINATTHAREWAAPEVSTGTIERLVAGAGDAGLIRYLLDNTRLVIIPVHNIDGLLQAQRFPTQAIVGLDPDVATWPRDGRMRRKNMRGVDEILTTFNDHLGGIDLNRNHPPFWATLAGQGGSSTNPNSLTFHGAGPHSEPENLALEHAAELGPASRFRLGIDVHSHSRVYFSSNTARVRLNSIQANLIARMSGHHLQLSGKSYADVPDPANRGIGAAAEYFAYEWLVPAWTLELEPQNSPVEYGGFNVNHGGFILPASEARRVRESWAETHAVAFYMMSGPPHLSRLRVYDPANNALVLETRWQFDSSSARRERVATVPGALQPGRRYRAELAFNKPMRYRDAAGNIAPLPGVSGVQIHPSVALVRDSGTLALDASGGAWLNDTARVRRYRDDTFAFEFTAPADAAEYRLEVGISDMTAQQLDADPSTPADWSAGAWSEWENASGVDGDVGGVDRSATLRVDAAAVSQVEVLADARTLGEGDTVQLRLRRAQSGPERVDVSRLNPNGELSPPPVVVATWLPGESGERSVPISWADNLIVDGDRSLDIRLSESVDGVLRSQSSHTYRILDNDRADAAVFTVRSASGLNDSWSTLSQGSPPREVVLFRDVTYTLPPGVAGNPATDLAVVTSDFAIHGNGATIRAGGEQRQGALVRIASGGRLSLRNIRMDVFERGDSRTRIAAGLFENTGELEITRSTIDGYSPKSVFVRNEGVLQIERSSMHLWNGLSRFVNGTELQDPLIDQVNGETTVTASTLYSALYIGYTSLVLAVKGGSLHAKDSAIFGFPAAESVPPAAAELRTSVVLEMLDTLWTLPPEFFRAPCEAPALRGLGWNLFGANYEGGVPEQFPQSGCFVAAATDRFIGRERAFDHAGGDATNFFEAYLLVPSPGGAAIDAAPNSECNSVDQFGRPRPQAVTQGNAPRCDIGAIELGVNPYRGIWQPERDGHGVEIHTSGNNLLLVWYTYADDGQPTSYQAVAPLTGSHWEADLLQPRRDPASGVVSTPRVGRVTLDFDGDADARIGWRFDARGTTGSERIRPAVFANGDPRFEVSGVWYPSAEPGYGATITRRGEATAVVLYYYDAAGNIRWVLGAGNGADALDIEMSSYTGFCPDCNAASMPVVGRAAGRLLVHFHTPERARLDTQITYPGAAGGTWNRERAILVPLNDPIDRRSYSIPNR